MSTIFERFEACSLRRDGHAFAELFTDDAVMEFPFSGQRYVGREAIRARVVTAWAASPVVVRELADRIVAEFGDSVCVEYTARVTAQDKPCDVRIVLRLRLREGRIAEMREYLDPAALAEVRGATTLAVLRRYHDAMRTKSADALAELYAVDAVHELSFFTPNRPRELITGLLVVRVHNGQIVHTRDFMDGLGIAHALGRAPFAG
jgi:uncharacterized protein (TIGR02246 family)